VAFFADEVNSTNLAVEYFCHRQLSLLLLHRQNTQTTTKIQPYTDRHTRTHTDHSENINSHRRQTHACTQTRRDRHACMHTDRNENNLAQTDRQTHTHTDHNEKHNLTQADRHADHDDFVLVWALPTACSDAARYSTPASAAIPPARPRAAGAVMRHRQRVHLARGAVAFFADEVNSTNLAVEYSVTVNCPCCFFTVTVRSPLS